MVASGQKDDWSSYYHESLAGERKSDALNFEVDILWIGARTTVNPFSIQEVADALRGIDVPVLIKNPINPDLELWTGALERVMKAGIKQVGLIHRGFSSYGNTEYRNAPMWHLAIEMKRRYPDIMMICDPSHICGRRDILLDVAQKAIDLDFHGLMIESHIDPDNAWSDAKQQVTPERLGEIIGSIKWRFESTTEKEFITALEKLREQINHIDDELMQLIGQRMKIADKIGEYKKNNSITILQTNRWNEILERAFAKGELLGLSKEFITKYFDAVHMESINHQNKVMRFAVRCSRFRVQGSEVRFAVAVSLRYAVTVRLTVRLPFRFTTRKVDNIKIMRSGVGITGHETSNFHIQQFKVCLLFRYGFFSPAKINP